MNSGAIGAISTHVTALGLGTSTYGVANDLSSGEVFDGLVGAAGLAEGLASIASKGNPALAALVGAYQLQDTLGDIASNATQNGTVDKADVSKAAAAVTGTIGGIVLGLTAAAVTTAALPVVLGAALVVTAAALTIQAEKQALAGENWETPEIKEMNDAVKKFMDDFGDVAKQITDALLDPAFWEAFAEQGAKLFEPLLDPLNEAGRWIGQNLPTLQEIEDAVRNWWDSAKDWIARRDPLTFDLDGDGLETVGISSTSPILFDHDGDGTKNGTGWVKSDDAMLVLDKNGNGTIDNGLELFGDSTVKSNGLKATDGFDALADLDSNADGVVNNQDSQFTNLRLWRDLNQDGISQAGELFTLNELGIVGINVASTEHSTTLSNGNQLADTGSFIKADGSTGTVGEVTGNIGDINLADSTFHREFADTLDTSAVTHLPDMQGSGALRDLREAATQSSTLQNLLTQYSVATTRDAQMGLIDQLLDAWADTSGFAESYADRLVGLTAPVTNGDGSTTSLELPYAVEYLAFGNVTNATFQTDTTSTTAASGSTGGGTISNTTYTPEFQALINSWNQKVHILEAFNGNYFFGLPSQPEESARSGLTIKEEAPPPDAGANGVSFAATIGISYSPTQIDLLQKSYDALKSSVYDALLLQTRFKPLLDQIDLVIDSNGVRLDFTQMAESFNQEIATDPESGLIDLIEFNVASKTMLKNTSWNGWQTVAESLNNTPPTQKILDVIASNNILVSTVDTLNVTGTQEDDVVFGNASANTINGGLGDDYIFGDAGDDVLNGGGGNDLLDGGDGNDTLIGSNLADTLIGGAGNDVLNGHAAGYSNYDTAGNLYEGGTGNDTLNGTAGSDTYLYNKGDGADIINEGYQDGNTTSVDKIMLGADIAVSDVILMRENGSADLIVKFTNAGDSITIKNWYSNESYRVEQLVFADGTIWDKAKLTADGTVVTGTSGNDTLNGLSGYNNTLIGGAGNDTLVGVYLADTLIGGAGDDVLNGAAAGYSNYDTAGNLYEGGTGNDTLNGTAGSDTYLYNKGDGADIINEGYQDGNTTSVDKIMLGADIAVSDVILMRENGSADLIVKFTNAGDSITIKNWYSNESYRVEQLVFADGTIWDKAKLTADGTVVTGTSGNDTLNGLSGYNNTLIGGDGNDTLNGSNFSDTLIGGAGDDILHGYTSSGYYDVAGNVYEGGTGNDTLNGTSGSDTYRYNKGDGADIINEGNQNGNTTSVDKIILGANIAVSDVTLSRPNNSNNLVLNFANAGDSITINHWYSIDTYRIEQVVFADGTIWDKAKLTAEGSVVIGTTGNDTLSGLSAVNNTLLGMAGNDTLNGGNLADTLIGGAGDDILNGYVAGYSYHDTVGNLYEGGTGNDTLNGTAGSDTYRYNKGDGADIINEGYQNNITTSVDKIVLGADIAVSDVTLSRPNGTTNLVLKFANAGDSITINNWFSSNDYRVEQLVFSNNISYSLLGLTGTDNGDILLGTTLADNMTGGLGDDIYFVDAAGDLVTEAVNAGTDTVFANVTHTLGENVENLTLTGATAINGTGNADSNIIIGNDGNNVIDGLAGNDMMKGGLGDDTYILDSATDIVIENAASGVDTVKVAYNNSASELSLNVGVGNLANVENVIITGTGLYNIVGDSANNNLTGNASDNHLTGDAGNDTLDGGAGNDVLIGGTGDDIFVIDASTDIVTENVNEGIDTLKVAYSNVAATAVEITIGSGAYTNIENATVVGTGLFNLTGSVDNNVLIGNASANRLSSGDGNDTLDGGAGNDTLVGGFGDDVYIVDATADIVIEAVNAGIDTVQSTVTYTLSNNVENLTLTGTNSINGTGNVLDNLLIGNSGSNTLDGNSGSDTMRGGAGNDSYKVDVLTDIIIENVNEGTDLVNVAIATENGTYALGANLENATLTNTVAYTLTGNDLNNTLIGNAAANTLNGGAGNDTMIGGAGNDTMIGGAGDDIYTIDVLTDIVTEGVNEGTDLVNVAVTLANGNYVLAANVENATLTNTVSYTLTGNELNNVLTGNASANTLNGGDGDDTLNGAGGTDTMVGGFGNDTYTIDVLTDIVVESASAGVDTVKVAIATTNGSYTLGANLENASLINSVAYTLYGNELNNVLTGNGYANTLNGLAGNDTLNGGAGVDTLVGGDGDDTYIVDTTTDVITEADTVGAGVDTVQSSVTYTLGAASNLENLILTGTSAINATGNALANYMMGNSANNTLTDTAGGNDMLQGLAGVDTFNDTAGNNLLDGGLGNDIINAGSGNDLLIGGLGNDTITTGTGYDVIVFNKGDGQDIINASGDADNTLSLGGNFAYSDLSLTKSTNDLILKVGTSDQITLKDWYLGTTNKSVVNLQVIAESMTAFSLGGADALRDNKVENFNFANMVAAFDAEGATANWQLTDERLTSHLQAGSDTAAIGGDLAYQYGKNSNLAGMGLMNAQSVISAASFGQTAQTLNDPSVWQAEVVKLG